MTEADTGRGRGKPRAFDEDELLERVHSIDDLQRVRDALEANGEGLTARGVFAWLTDKWLGGTGRVDRRSESSYRAALARLPHDPLGPPSKRRRIAARSQRGLGDVRVVRVAAGVGALALVAPLLPHVPPIMLQPPTGPLELDLAA